MTDVSDETLPEWTDEELAVLRSADDDKPPSRSLSATLAAVGVGGALASGAAAAKGASIAATTGSGMAAAKWTSFIAATKWISVVALSGAVVGGGVVLVQRADSARDAALTSKQAHAPVQNGVAHGKSVAVPVPEPIVEEAPVPAADEPEPTSPSSARAPAVRSQPDISLEIAALDSARSALRSGRTGEALTALDHYDASYAKAGSLRVEATALRIEALLRSGKRARATSLANAFLARNPKSPYAARVRALIGDGAANR
jgi:hypothetical protein